MKLKERAKILKERNNKYRSLLFKLRRDLNFLLKQKYNSTIPPTLINARIKEINNITQKETEEKN